MGRPINSDYVSTGQNAENAQWADNKYLRCSRCGFICHYDRDRRGTEGSRVGWGSSHPETAISSTVAVGDTTINVDSTTGFPTPMTGSITAFATARSGKATTVTSASHGLTNKGGQVVITGTTNYNGTFYLQDILTNTFVIAKAFVANDATGTWTRAENIYIQKDSVGLNGITYTGLSATTFTGCSGAKAHAADDEVYGDKIDNGCPFCGTLMFHK